MSMLLRLPIGTALGLGIGAGFAATAANVMAGHTSGPRTVGPDGRYELSPSQERGRAMLLAGPVLAAGGIGLSMRLDRVPQYGERFLVDAAEQVTRTRVFLDWSGRGGRLGAITSGLGVGLMTAGPAALSW
jgi:hypothetical protein